MNLSRFRREEETPTIPLTSMIDVLFLMIIFLVMSANFDVIQSVVLPEGHGAERKAEATTAQVVLRADGALLVDGALLPPDQALARLKTQRPRQVLLLPDRKAEVGALFRWYDRIGRELGVPVQVGVREPGAPK